MQGKMCNKNNGYIAQFGRNEKATMYFLTKSFIVEAIKPESWHQSLAIFKLFNSTYRLLWLV